MATKVVERKRKLPQMLPLVIIGGIEPNRTYCVREFLAITRISRQKFSELRRQENGLIVRDAGTPTILGKDWLDFVARQPVHVAKQRRPPSKVDASRNEQST